MLNVGSAICGFHVDSVTDVPDVGGRMWRMTYEKNGAELVWLERDDEGTVCLRFELELLYALVFAEVESYIGIATQSDAADSRVNEETVFASVINQLFVGNEGVACELDTGDTLYGVNLDIF